MWLTHFSLVLILCFLELAIGFFGWTTAPEQLASFNKRYSLKVEHSPWQFTIPAGKLFFEPSFLRGYVKLPGCRFLEDKSKCFLSECSVVCNFSRGETYKSYKFLHRNPWVSVSKSKKSQFDFVKAVFFSGPKTQSGDLQPGISSRCGSFISIKDFFDGSMEYLEDGLPGLVSVVNNHGDSCKPPVVGVVLDPFHSWPWKWRTKMGLGWHLLLPSCGMILQVPWTLIPNRWTTCRCSWCWLGSSTAFVCRASQEDVGPRPQKSPVIIGVIFHSWKKEGFPVMTAVKAIYC